MKKSNSPIIKPISDLRNKANTLSKLVQSVSEPVFITKNGVGDMVLMSMGHYNNMQRRLDLYAKLSAAQTMARRGIVGSPASQVIQRLKKRIREA